MEVVLQKLRVQGAVLGLTAIMQCITPSAWHVIEMYNHASSLILMTLQGKERSDRQDRN